MPTINGILETALYVKDIERSAAFYERALGFKRLWGDERLIGMGVQGAAQILLLFREGASTMPSPMHDGLIPAHDGHGQLHLAFAIPEMDREGWIGRLAAEGIVPESVIHTDRGGTSVYFRDPDDHLVELATPGIWPVY